MIWIEPACMHWTCINFSSLLNSHAFSSLLNSLLNIFAKVCKQEEEKSPCSLSDEDRKVAGPSSPGGRWRSLPGSPPPCVTLVEEQVFTTETLSLFPQGFLPTLEKLPTEEYAKVMITFTIAFVAVLFLKVNGCRVWWGWNEAFLPEGSNELGSLLSQIWQGIGKSCWSLLGCERGVWGRSNIKTTVVLLLHMI